MTSDLTMRFVSLIGLGTMLLLALMLSENRKAIKPRVVWWALGLQLILAFLVLKTRPGEWLFTGAEKAFAAFVSFSNEGASFVFGKLAWDPSFGALIAFSALPIIIFASAVAGVLYYLRITQTVVKAMAWVMQKTMRISGAEALAAALFVFLGIEVVPTIDKYIRRMTRSEMFVVMTAFMATIAVSVMMIYSTFGASPGHLLTASLMSAPAAICMAKMMIPETGTPVTAGTVQFEPEITSANIIDAAADGASQGVKLAINVGAVLIAFVGLVALVNFVLRMCTGLTLPQLFGFGFSPFALVMGVSPEDALNVGQLLGTKTVFNEFLAYRDLQAMILNHHLSDRSVVIATYALCGFANFGSMAILIGGIAGVTPERRGEVAALGFKALISGTLAAFMTACFAGILI